ncbi:MAG: hypothetical protein WC196_03015 [Bacilli bacterium]
MNKRLVQLLVVFGFAILLLPVFLGSSFKPSANQETTLEEEGSNTATTATATGVGLLAVGGGGAVVGQYNKNKRKKHQAENNTLKK